MYPDRYFIPNMGNGYVPVFGSNYVIPRAPGLFSRLTRGIRSVNWRGLLTNANKTLDVVNQTIPLVRKAGPMVNNMKSMLSIAKAFGNETVSKKNNVSNNKVMKGSTDKKDDDRIIINTKKESITSDQPSFFV